MKNNLQKRKPYVYVFFEDIKDSGLNYEWFEENLVPKYITRLDQNVNVSQRKLYSIRYS